MTTKHTPTPWSMTNPVDNTHYAVWFKDNKTFDGPLVVADNLTKANAAYIVRAVNAHSALLEALQEIKMRGGVDAEIAREAIAKAEGK